MKGYFTCKRCSMVFLSETKVKAHLQHDHNIPPREFIEGIESILKKMLNTNFYN